MPQSVSKRPQPILSPKKARRYRAGLLVALALAGVVLGSVWWVERVGNVNHWTRCDRAGIRIPARYGLHGIDVSKFQGKIDWQRVRHMRLTDQGLPLAFAFIKATEGRGLADRAFQKNWEGAKKAGLRRGAYHFYLPFRDPVEQANHFVQHVRLERGDLAPVLDIEVNALKPDDAIVRDLGIWLDRVEKHYGIRPIIYTNPHFYRKFIRGHFDEHPLWLADYSRDRLEGYPSGQVYFWQHSKRGWCEGIGGQVDFNAFLFDEDELEEICVD